MFLSFICTFSSFHDIFPAVTAFCATSSHLCISDGSFPGLLRDPEGEPRMHEREA